MQAFQSPRSLLLREAGSARMRGAPEWAMTQTVKSRLPWRPQATGEAGMWGTCRRRFRAFPGQLKRESRELCRAGAPKDIQAQIIPPRGSDARCGVVGCDVCPSRLLFLLCSRSALWFLVLLSFCVDQECLPCTVTYRKYVTCSVFLFNF